MAAKRHPRCRTFTRTRFSVQPSSRAISIRTNDGICVVVCSVNVSSFSSARQNERLQGRVGDRLGAKRMLEHAPGRRKGRVNVAAAQLIVERDVGVLAPRQMLEIGEGPGGFSSSCTITDDVSASTSS